MLVIDNLFSYMCARNC